MNFKKKFCKHEYENIFQYTFYKKNDIKLNPTGQVILKLCRKCGDIKKIEL